MFSEPGDLIFDAGEQIEVVKKENEWWTGKIGDRTGVFPYNYVEEASAGVTTAAPDEAVVSEVSCETLVFTKKNPILNRMFFFREINFIFDTKKENDFLTRFFCLGLHFYVCLFHNNHHTFFVSVLFCSQRSMRIWRALFRILDHLPMAEQDLLVNLT